MTVQEIKELIQIFSSFISKKISDFKLTSFKNNVGLQLMEEQLKLDIYHIINDAL